MVVSQKHLCEQPNCHEVFVKASYSTLISKAASLISKDLSGREAPCNLGGQFQPLKQPCLEDGSLH